MTLLRCHHHLQVAHIQPWADERVRGAIRAAGAEESEGRNGCGPVEGAEGSHECSRFEDRAPGLKMNGPAPPGKSGVRWAGTPPTLPAAHR